MLPFLSHAEEKSNYGFVIDLMTNAKVSGMCGVFSQMVEFQNSAKIPGGGEFIVRFIEAEASRLGRTSTSFLDSCVEIARTNSTAMKLLKEKQRRNK